MPGAFDRRSILLGGVTLVGGTAVVGALAGCPPTPESGPAPPERDPANPVAPDGEMTVGEVLPILVAFGDRLIPADDLGPGAKAAGLELFLEKNLADPRMKAIKSICTRGAVFLGRAARKEHGKAFWELDEAQRDAFVKRLANNEVRPNGFSPQAFVRIMLALSLEAFLGDPRHGGNKNNVGWEFIGGLNWAGRIP